MVPLIIVMALAFDFMNGFHDAANSIATVVSTRMLHSRWAVVWAAMGRAMTLEQAIEYALVEETG